MFQRLGCLCLLALLTAAPAARGDDNNLADLDLATLMSMDVTITSAAKHAQASADAAAAVYVITREDIRRSGATSLPQLLRYVPGLQVARIDTRGWSVTARGASSRFANKLLVMIDGRSIYTTIFSGIIWEEHSPLLDNIERIEVVRGPGGALWGINAVNGVINIITRNASESAGLFLEANGGTDQSGAAIRYGADSNLLGPYRVYLNHDGTEALDGNDSEVARTSGGWRLDRESFGGVLTFEGELSRDDFSEFDNLPDSAYHRYANGGNALLDWDRSYAAGQLELRASYSEVHRTRPGEWNESSAGMDAQFSAARMGAHLLTTGGGVRYVKDDQVGYIPELQLSKTSCGHLQWNVYAQDEVHLFGDAAQVIVGAKLEDFELTGIAFQPTVRGLWKVNSQHTLWAAVSRAARTPSRFELHSKVASEVADAPFPVYLRMSGDADLKAEDLRAYELGWRWRPRESLSFDLALYHNDYRDLISVSTLR